MRAALRSEMLAPRYAGVPTFMRAPLVPREALSSVDVGLFGVPFDGGVTNRPGARLGPREVRNASSMMRAVHSSRHRARPFEQCAVGDLGDVPIEHVYSVGRAHEEIEAFASAALAAGVTPLAIGGDHSVTLPLLRAASAAHGAPLGLIHVDAHCDTWCEQWGERDHHGAPMRRAVECGAVDPARVVQIGIRGPQNFTDGWDWAEASGFTVLYMERCVELGVAGVVDAARAVVERGGGGGGPVYLSFDIDALDPAFAPGTGTPECGGFTTREAMQLLRGLRGLAPRLCGADVVEVAPPFDVGAPAGGGLTSLAGATIAYEILCLLSESRAPLPRNA